MRIKTLGAAVFCASLIGSLLVSTSPAQASDIIPASKDGISGQYVVVLKSSVSNPEGVSAAIIKGSGATKNVIYKSALKGFSVRANKGQIGKIARSASVKAVYQDAYAHADATAQPVPAPPDTFWGLNRIDQRTIPANAAGSYVYSYTGSGVNVYVIDTGIRTTHTQFGGRATFDFAATGIGGGLVDCHGHGTHVAGTVGGATYGVAKLAKLHAIKVLDCSGSGSFTQVIQGVDFVRTHASPFSVANMSLGGGYFPPLNDAVNQATDFGITFAVAAGNSNANACNSSPASAVGSISVGSTGSGSPSAPISDARSSFSNYGGCVDIFAPGSFIRSSINTSDTAAATFSGTSMASPHVAGVAALYLQKQSAYSKQVKTYLTDFATPGKVINPGTGSPNKLLFAGNSPVLTANGTPEPITCTRNITVTGSLALLGQAVPNQTIEVWFDQSGSTPPALKGTAVTNSSGVYARTVSQAADGSWYAIYRGAPLIGGKTSLTDFVDCSNK